MLCYGLTQKQQKGKIIQNINQMKHINYIIVSALLALCASCGQPPSQGQGGRTIGNDSILAIREQGSFLIGGTIKTAQGTYDTHQPLKPDGQTLHGDHAYVSYLIPANARKIRSYSCTGPDSLQRLGKAHPTDVKGSPPSSCVVVSAHT